MLLSVFRKPFNFNPRSPHGERHVVFRVLLDVGSISTHAPRTGSDGTAVRKYPHIIDFNPRSPHGERRASLAGR